MNKIYRLLISLFTIFILNAFSHDAHDKRIFISVDSDTLETLEKYFSFSIQNFNHDKNIVILEVPENKLGLISTIIHENFNRCGGFMVEEDLETFSFDWSNIENMTKNNTHQYNITQQDQVFKGLSKISADRLKETIVKLSQFKNRYYKSKHGIESQNWIKKEWQKITEGNDDITIESFKHSKFPQPSIILTWQGKSKADEQIVLGGHGDSISGFFPHNNIVAPGADDNASGIASLTEVIRVLVDSGFKPERTVKIISYAAEEVGLKGSHEIAMQAKENNLKIIGVLQLDMTNFQGSDRDIILMSDFTNSNQNQFLADLIDTYLPNINWEYDECGYACSDHASWTRAGFAASFPFESKMDEHNPKIHTSGDLLEVSHDHALHAEKFTKLAFAYVNELSK